MSQPAFDFGDDDLDDGANPTYTVGELAEAINSSFQRSFGDGIWVRGEITGWSDRGNHAYFSLADDSGEGAAVVNVQFFAPARMRLRPMLQKHRLRLADGMKVRVFGYLDYYAPTGRVGLKMTGIDPKYTLGDIAQLRDEVVRRLVAEGLLDRNRRLPSVAGSACASASSRASAPRRGTTFATNSSAARWASSCPCATCGSRASSPRRWSPLESARWRGAAISTRSSSSAAVERRTSSPCSTPS